MPAAIVLNMFYTGLGIARSLGEQGIPVIGLTATKAIYGNFTRYADIRVCPDSREFPEKLLAYLLRLREELPVAAVLFPTRDHDVLFLDRYRKELETAFHLVLPSKTTLQLCLDKWSSYTWAKAAAVATPRCWRIESRADLLQALPEVRFPAVLKPVAAHQWRTGRNWELVGGRKAIPLQSASEATAAYETVMQADNLSLLQEMVPGGDDALWIAGCYLDKDSRFIGGFTAQKLLQVPTGFGTGCIVQSVDRPEILQQARVLLEKMRYSGIAEVEFKRNPVSQRLELIEVNPRPWDQHRLGHAAGVDLIHLAYCDRAGLPLPVVGIPQAGYKWIAEDVFVTLLLTSIWRGAGNLRQLFRLASGRRTYAIFSISDPVPAVGFFILRFIPGLFVLFGQYVRLAFRRAFERSRLVGKRAI
jgi:D-aspartate ligase